MKYPIHAANRGRFASHASLRSDTKLKRSLLSAFANWDIGWPVGFVDGPSNSAGLSRPCLMAQADRIEILLIVEPVISLDPHAAGFRFVYVEQQRAVIDLLVWNVDRNERPSDRVTDIGP